jgi:hypothetical protein
VTVSTFFRLLGLSLLLEAIACTPPPRLVMEDLPLLVQSTLHHGVRSHTFIASGEVTICTRGEVHSGAIDVKCDSNGSFAANIYGPLGVLIASVSADTAQGSVATEKGRQSFRCDQTMDTLPFAWGRNLSFKDIIAVFSGIAPDSLAAILARPPDSIIEKKKTINFVWNTDILKAGMTIKKKSNRVATVFFEHMKNAVWSLKLAGFRQGCAYKIELREDDRNYFFITYEKIRYK